MSKVHNMGSLTTRYRTIEMTFYSLLGPCLVPRPNGFPFEEARSRVNNHYMSDHGFYSL